MSIICFLLRGVSVSQTSMTSRMQSARLIEVSGTILFVQSELFEISFVNELHAEPPQCVNPAMSVHFYPETTSAPFYHHDGPD
jgi:hypothetical protein